MNEVAEFDPTAVVRRERLDFPMTKPKKSWLHKVDSNGAHAYYELVFGSRTEDEVRQEAIPQTLKKPLTAAEWNIVAARVTPKEVFPESAWGDGAVVAL